MSTKLTVNPAIAQRLQAFIHSDLFAVRSPIAKSEYWKYQAELLQAQVGVGSVSVAGLSGFYVPKEASALGRALRRVRKAFTQPSKAFNWAANQVRSRIEVPRSMSYEQAFDAVMSHAPVSDPDLSRFRINHLNLAQRPKVLTDTASVKRHYQKWSGYEASSNIVIHYYYQNILRGFIGEGQTKTILDIGAGNGNLPSILYHDWAPVRMILVDLPETLAVAIPFLSGLFPSAKLVLPHEAHADGLPEEFDFAFLTVDQLAVLGDSTVDLAMNCHSFQEMTHEQIAVYFRLVQRVCRESGLFFVANNVEKIPCGPNSYTVVQTDPPNRFAEYPWNPRNETLFYEVSRLSRLASLEALFIRLERIRK